MDTVDKSEKVELIELTPQPTLSIRGVARVEQLGETMGERLGALTEYVRQSGAQPVGPAFVRYHAFDAESDTDFEVGFPVAEPVAGEGRIAAQGLPGGSAIATFHMGPHDKLGDAYGRLHEWLRVHGRESDGPGWEVYYWVDLRNDAEPSIYKDPTGWGTRLVQPIE